MLVLAFLANWCVANRSAATESHFERFFQENELTGWEKVGDAGFSVRDGVLLCDGSGNIPTWLRSQETYENFVLRFEYRMAADGDGGVFLHAPLHGQHG